VNEKRLKPEAVSQSVQQLTGMAALALTVLLLAGCGHRDSAPATSLAPSQTPQQQFLRDELSQIAAPAQGRMGVFAVLIETNQTVASLNSDDDFPMQSVYKLPICMAIMKQVDEGKLTLDQKIKIAKQDYVPEAAYSPIRDKNPNGAELTVNELVRFALSESDGTASDVLMKLAGGNAAVQAYLNSLPLAGIIVLNTEKELAHDWQAQYRNSAKPASAVDLLRALYEHRALSESSRGLLLQDMEESTPGAKRLRGLLPQGTVVAHKTGTSGTQKGITAATNDIGIVTLPNGKHLAIAVFVSDSPADEAGREAVIAKAAKLVFDTAHIATPPRRD
jgi:beta-lactamase class A